MSVTVDKLIEGWWKLEPALMHEGGMSGMMLRSVAPEIPKLLEALDGSPAILTIVKEWLLDTAQAISEDEGAGGGGEPEPDGDGGADSSG
jgi:hypothetical protein